MKQRHQTKRDKDSILVDVKQLIKLYHPVYQRMPKIERIDGCAREFKVACYDMVRHFCVAYNCPEAKVQNIQLMAADFGVMMALLRMVNLEWWHYCYWNVRRQCISPVPSQRHRQRVCRRYGLKIKE